MRKLPLMLALLILAQLVPSLPRIDEAAAILPTSTGAVGKSPSVYGQLVSFTTAETAVQIDLNGDGDKLDTIIRHYNVSSGTVTNTRVEGVSPSIFGNIIAYATPMGLIQFYNITSDAVFNTGLTGESPRIWGNLIVFVGLDQRVKTYNMVSRAVEDTGALGANPSVHETLIGFSTSEGLVQADLNGDGSIDPFTSVVRYYDTLSRRTVNTAAVGEKTSTYGNIIAFDYALNAPIRFYNTTSGTVTDTGLAGFSPAAYGDHVFLENGTIRMFEVSTGTQSDTRIDGTSPSAYKNLVAFETDENIVNKDLNGDHIVKDVIIRYFQLPLHDVAVTSVETSSPTLTDPLGITVRVSNLGDFGESFILSILWNYTIIQTFQVTLNAQASTSVTASWSTSSLNPGAYVINAGVSVIPSESETANNAIVDGTFLKQSVIIGGGGGGRGLIFAK